MTSQVEELINKIKQEGVRAAQEKASDIEIQAQKKADEILTRAREQAERITDEAQKDADKTKQNARIAIQQAARDALLALRKNIENTLKDIVLKDVQETLTTESLVGIIEHLVKNFSQKDSEKQNIEILLNARDLEKLKKGFTAKLKEKLKQPIVLKAAEDINRGFLISFDEGKSCFDFSDESLAEFLGEYLSGEITSLVQTVVKKEKKS